MKHIIIAAVFAVSMLFSQELEMKANLIEPQTITDAELGFIYKGRIKHWSTGERIHVIIRPKNSKTQDNLIRMFLGISTNKFREYVARNSNIKVVEDTNIVAAMIKKTGSLGLVDNSIIVDIDGKLVLVHIVRGL